ncbi:hypothetical protein KHA80_02465 [Anaerobacillus sp. HL2]|nr:hypothetical protein KHA80_02465 [Anaerobacillus sp. HL2]
MEEMFTRGEKVTIAGVALTAVSAGANPANGEFNVGNTKEEQAYSIKKQRLKITLIYQLNFQLQ